MLIKNDLFTDSKGIKYRILHISVESDQAWIINIENQTAVPEQVQYSNLNTLAHDGKLGVFQAKQLGKLPPISEATKRRRDLAWMYIEPLVNDPNIFYPSHRKSAIAKRAKELKPISIGSDRSSSQDNPDLPKNKHCSESTIYTYLRAYWQNGQSIDALRRDFYKSGNRTLYFTGGRGRKSTAYTTFQLSEEDVKNIRKVLEEFYLKDELPSLPIAREEIRKNYYFYVDGNDTQYLKPDGECPSLRQIRGILYKYYPEEVRLRRKLGDKKFENDHAPRLGSVLDACYGVGHIYEIDATIADIYLVAKDNRSRIIGKPTLYLIFDRYSRLIVGFLVTLEPASWPSAMQAILSIAEDKEQLCYRYGLPYDLNDWPAHGMLPEKFLGDRGEMISKDSNRLCDGVHTTVSNTPANVPRRKGTVELGCRLIPQTMGPKLLGYDPPTSAKRRIGRRYENDACQSLDEFASNVLDGIITSNRSVMKDYPLSRDLVAEGVRPIPRELWRHNMQKRVGSLSRYPLEYLRFQLLPQEKATVTEEGIYYGACFYDCAEAKQLGWFVMAKNNKRFKINISINRTLVDFIYIHHPDSRDHYFIGELTTKSVDYAGLSFAEVADIELQKKEIVASGQLETDQRRSDHRTRVEKSSKQAHKEMKRESAGKSRSARKKDIQSDRDAERRERRLQEADSSLGKTADTEPIFSDTDTTSPWTTVRSGESDGSGSGSITAADASYSSHEEQTSIEKPSRPLTIAEKLRLKRSELLNGK